MRHRDFLFCGDRHSRVALQVFSILWRTIIMKTSYSTMHMIIEIFLF